LYGYEVNIVYVGLKNAKIPYIKGEKYPKCTRKVVLELRCKILIYNKVMGGW
jgi:hypothetical protein